MTDATAAELAVLEARGIVRGFAEGSGSLQVLRGLQLQVAAGERIAIVGVSGSGKTTLLQVLGGLDAPDAGQVLVQGQDIHAMPERQRCALRNRTLGFIYQFHHLLPEFSALENVAMPLLVRREPVADAMASARELLRQVGLSDRLEHRPHQLSGGERQRAAVARALVTQPRLVLADEPTGNLDSRNGAIILELLRELSDETGTALLLVTHSGAAAQICHREIHLRDGQIGGAREKD